VVTGAATVISAMGAGKKLQGRLANILKGSETKRKVKPERSGFCFR